MSPGGEIKRDLKLAAIVNSRNRLALLKVALPSLVAALRNINSSAIIIFDAGSDDGSLEYIKSVQADISIGIPIYCCQPAPQDDRSFSAGVNSAARYAMREFPNLEWLFLFETDNCIVNLNALPLAIDLLKTESRLAGAGFTVEKYDGSKAGFGCPFPGPLSFIFGTRLTAWAGRLFPKTLDWQDRGQCSWALCDVVYTSPILICREAWEKSGGLDEKVFPFSDCDIDWAWRIYKMGWRLGVLKISGVIHDNKNIASQWSVTRTLDFHKARLSLLQRHLGRWVMCIKPILFFRHCIELMLILPMVAFIGYPKEAIGKRLVLIKTVFKNYSYQ